MVERRRNFPVNPDVILSDRETGKRRKIKLTPQQSLFLDGLLSKNNGTVLPYVNISQIFKTKEGIEMSDNNIESYVANNRERLIADGIPVGQERANLLNKSRGVITALNNPGKVYKKKSPNIYTRRED